MCQKTGAPRNADHGDAPFGIAASSIGALAWQQAADRYRWPDAWAEDPVHFVVRELS